MSFESIRKGMLSHLGESRYRIRSGDDAIGWKMGFRDEASQRQLGLPGPVASRLHASNLLPADEAHDISDAKQFACEAELGVVLASDVRADMSDAEILACIGEFLPVIELVDVNLPMQDIRAILAGGVFHRALQFGAPLASTDAANITQLSATITVTREGVPDEVQNLKLSSAYPNVADILRQAATFLAEFGDAERLQAADLIILGAMLPPHQATPGDRYTLQIADEPAVHVDIVGLAAIAAAPQPEINYNIPANLQLNRHESQALATSLSRLAHELAGGNPTTLRNPPFSNELIRDIQDARQLTRDARSRQLRRLAKVLWFHDIAAIRAELNLHSDVHRQRKGREKSYETWRARVMQEGDDASTALVEAFPSIDRQRLRALVRQAHLEPDGERARQSQTQLLRMIREAGELALAPAPADSHISSKDPDDFGST